MEIKGINPISINTTGATSAAGAAGSVRPGAALDNVTKTFGDMLNSLNESQQNADTLTQKLAAGEDVDLHQVMIGLEENDVNFRVAMAIRDRLVDAYREVMRMSI